MPAMPGPGRAYTHSGEVTGVRLAGRLWLRLLCAVAIGATALPATSLAQGVVGDTWFRAAIVRRTVEPPYRTQLDDSIYARSDCGPAVLGMALAAYGIEDGRARWISRAQLDQASAPVWPPRQAVAVGA